MISRGNRWPRWLLECVFIHGVGRHRPQVDSTLLSHPEFPNILLFRYWTQLDILQKYEDYEPQIDHILSLIGGELR